MRQYQRGGDVWAAIEANQQRISEVELSLTRQLGQISSQIASLSAGMITEQRFEQLLERKQEQEERTWRGWNIDSIQQLRGYPAQRREEANAHYMREQTHAFQMQAIFAGLAIVLSPLLSVLVVKLFG